MQERHRRSFTQEYKRQAELVVSSSRSIVNGTRGPRSHGLGADGLGTALEAYRHPELPEGLDGCWNVAPGVLDDGLRSQRAPGRG